MMTLSGFTYYSLTLELHSKGFKIDLSNKVCDVTQDLPSYKCHIIYDKQTLIIFIDPSNLKRSFGKSADSPQILRKTHLIDNVPTKMH